jgi:phosphoglycolate phosphatase-like HAD superfamily hydrolase
MSKLRSAAPTHASPQTPRSVGGAARPMQKEQAEPIEVGRRQSSGRPEPRQRVNGKPLKIRPAAPGIIFDVEGTLVDCAFQVTESWRRTLQDFGYSLSALELHKYSGMDTDDMLRVLLPDAAGDEKDNIKSAQGSSYRQTFLPTVNAFPGVRALLEKLRRAGHRIGLATTAQGDELAVYLELTGAGEFVDVVACGDDKVRGKPHPDLFRLTLGRLGVRKNALAVGDTPYDAIGAGRAGIRSIGTMSGGFSLRELEDAGCYAVVGRLQQLPEYIDVRTQLG